MHGLAVVDQDQAINQLRQRSIRLVEKLEGERRVDPGRRGLLVSGRRECFSERRVEPDNIIQRRGRDVFVGGAQLHVDWIRQVLRVQAHARLEADI